VRHLKLAVLLSGTGRTLENIFDHIADGRLDAEVVVVGSSRADAYGLERARSRGVPTFVVPSREYRRTSALIPAFCGKGYYGHFVHEAVLRYGVKVSGCTVHFVDNVYDHGPIIIQKTVPVLDDDTPESLAARVFEKECEAYPEAIRLFGEGRLKIEGRRVRVLPEPVQES